MLCALAALACFFSRISARPSEEVPGLALAVGRLPALEGTDLAVRSAVEEPREGGHERSIDSMGNSGSPKRASEDSLRRHERGRCEVPGRAEPW